MKFDAVTGALGALVLTAAGCSEDVGNCYRADNKAGLDTVVRSGHVEYGGQAILNVACATGCHSSTATGAARHGAPAGLDFDLVPVAATSSTESDQNQNGRTYAVLDQAEINGLRARQRKVFSERNDIWTQVRNGEMPPDGMFASFRTAVKNIFDSDEASPCTRGSALKDIENKATQDILRNWLACQAPIVESYGGPVEVNGTAGIAGYQYLACSGGNEGDGGVGDGGMPGAVGFDQIYADIIMGAGSCSVCHPGAGGNAVDFSSEDSAFMDLVGNTKAQCGSKPWVTPGDPSKSYLVDLIELDKPCPSKSNIVRMPQGLDPLTASQIQEVKDWITAGALRTSALVLPAPLSGGVDAGVP